MHHELCSFCHPWLVEFHSLKPRTILQKVCEGLRVEGEEQAALQHQLEQQQAQLAAADEQHAADLVQLAALRLTALDGTPDKLLEQVTHISHVCFQKPRPKPSHSSGSCAQLLGGQLDLLSPCGNVWCALLS